MDRSSRSYFGGGPGGGRDFAAQSQGLTNVVPGSTADKKRKRKKRSDRLGQTPTPKSGPGSTSAGGYDEMGKAGYNPPSRFPGAGQGVGSTTSPSPTMSTADRDAQARGLLGGAGDQGLRNLGGAYGNLSTYGQQQAASNPAVGYGTYFNDLGSGSLTANYYGQMFNPQDLGIAAGIGASMGTDANIIAFGKSLADMMSGKQGLGMFLDPHTMIANILQQAAQMTSKAVQGGNVDINNPLAALATMGPQDQLETIASVIRGALSSVMSQESINSYIASIQMMAGQFADQWNQMPLEETERSGMNLAKFLMSRLGSDFGLGPSLV